MSTLSSDSTGMPRQKIRKKISKRLRRRQSQIPYQPEPLKYHQELLRSLCKGLIRAQEVLLPTRSR